MEKILKLKKKKVENAVIKYFQKLPTELCHTNINKLNYAKSKCLYEESHRVKKLLISKSIVENILIRNLPIYELVNLHFESESRYFRISTRL